MKVSPEQLIAHAQKLLAPIYVLCGEEILLINEAVSHLRQIALNKGYTERRIFDGGETGVWEAFLMATQSRSLFAEKELFECRLLNHKLTDNAQKNLLRYATNRQDNKIIIITLGKLTAAQQQASWFRALDKAGVVVTFWPVSAKQLPFWVKQRLVTAGFQIDNAALQFICEHVENNLLAAAQCVEKCQLLYTPGNLSLDQIIDALSPAAQYTVFDLVNAVWQKQIQKTLQILNILQTTGAEPAIILWAIARECRKNQQALFFPELNDVDQIIKGIKKASVWQALQRLCFTIMAKPLFRIKETA